MSSHDDRSKPKYGENFFLSHLPAFLFLVMCFVIMLISIIDIRPGRDPFPNPLMTAEASQALRQPVKAIVVDPSTPTDPVYAEGKALMAKSDCTTCHQDHAKVVGPAFADVAARYKDDKGALTALVHKVKEGGAGKWGAIPMTPHPTISDGDLEKIVKSVLLIPGGKFDPSTVAGVSATANKPAENDGMTLIKQNDCIACHAVDKLLIGPAYNDVAKKYKNDEATIKTLVAKVKAGGAGNWGQIPMTAHPTLDDKTLESMVKAVLALNPDNAPASASGASSGAPSLDGMALIKQNDCIACHTEDKLLVGPAYKDVAKKYKNDEATVKMLMDKVKKGGQGVWGQMPMTAHPTLDDKTLEAMVKAVLALNPDNAPASASGASSGVPSLDGMALIKQNDCIACHANDKLLVGPAYNDVAKKYKNDEATIKTLVAKVKAGGAGNWGQIPMTAHPTLDDKTLEAMVKAVLALNPENAAPANQAPANTNATGSGHDEGLALIKQNDCIACHTEDKLLVGPAYKDVAKKYKSDEATVKMLIDKVKKGGQGVWGQMPMTAHPNLDDKTLEKMVRAILALPHD